MNVYARCAFASALMVTVPASVWALPSKPVVDISDPRNDDKGPGSYIYPSDQNYHAGQFDLRRLRVFREKATVVFWIEVDSPLRRPEIARFSDAVEIKLENGVYVQNFDICLDTAKGQGEIKAVPGRRVRFRPEEAWDVCIVVTPLPYRARSLLDGWPVAGRVLVPTKVRSRDRIVEVRIPEVELGGPPDPSWGYQVVVSGAQWQNSFDAVNRLFGSYVSNVYTMPVTTVAEQLAFGGGELSDHHPWVIDILTPPMQSQFKTLGKFDARRRKYATIPMVYPDPAAHQRAAEAADPHPLQASPAPVLSNSDEFVYGTVKDVSGELVVLIFPGLAEDALKDPSVMAPFRLGDVLDDEGQVVAHVVTSQIHKSFVVATPVDGREQIRPDMKVRFRKPKEK